MVKGAERPSSPDPARPAAEASEREPSSGEAFVAALAAGHPAAERRFFTHYAEILRAIGRSRHRGLPLATIADAVQETLTRVMGLVRGGKVHEPDRFGALVVGVFHRVVLELLHAAGRERPAEEARLERAAPDNPEQTAASREALRMSRDVLAALPARDGEILELVLVLEADKDEVCRKFGLTRGHLRVLLHRAKERFRALYEQRNNAVRTRP